MPTPAVPCIACQKPLENVDADSENQCSGGLAFKSYGQYGSTAFDPLDGSYLEINLCDACLLQAAERKQVLWGRDHAPATVDGCIVGSVELVRPFRLVPWQPEADEHPQSRILGWSDIGEIERESSERHARLDLRERNED